VLRIERKKYFANFIKNISKEINDVADELEALDELTRAMA